MHPFVSLAFNWERPIYGYVKKIFWIFRFSKEKTSARVRLRFFAHFYPLFSNHARSVQQSFGKQGFSSGARDFFGYCSCHSYSCSHRYCRWSWSPHWKQTASVSWIRSSSAASGCSGVTVQASSRTCRGNSGGCWRVFQAACECSSTSWRQIVSWARSCVAGPSRRCARAGRWTWSGGVL